ncbi:MAG: hypothetical protein ACTSYB_01460 [Candidatus Helarchaeota archaeon]
MSIKRFKVVQCKHCGTLTYKRLTFKNPRCPICKKKLTSEPLKIFAKVEEAVKFIKQEKLKNKPVGGSWFETFE